MNYLAKVVIFGLIWGAALVSCQQASQQANSADLLQLPVNVPYYMQSPLGSSSSGGDQEAPSSDTNQKQSEPANQIDQRTLQAQQTPPSPSGMRAIGGARNLDALPAGLVVGATELHQQQAQTQIKPPQSSPPPPPPQPQQLHQQQPHIPTGNCFYDKNYFAKFDECLSKRPYPTVGLPAFKNEDLLIKRGLSERSGCLFVLSGGLFKNYQINKYSLDSDIQCLDGSKVGLQLGISNVTLSYLWSLRCLNNADQLLDDATMGGKTVNPGPQCSSDESAGNRPGICVGSSQNFGFTSLQLTNLDSQIELATDIYKNWRVTNVTVAMVTSPTLPQSTARSASVGSGGGVASASGVSSGSHNIDHEDVPVVGTNIRDFVFESLDGDELNWRYLHMYQNWSRNRMHANFVDQFRRFIWISLQRCLSESSEKLPVKLYDVFTNQKYN